MRRVIIHPIKAKLLLRIGPNNTIDWVSKEALEWALGKTGLEAAEQMHEWGWKFYTIGWYPRRGEIMPDPLTNASGVVL